MGHLLLTLMGVHVADTLWVYLGLPHCYRCTFGWYILMGTSVAGTVMGASMAHTLALGNLGLTHMYGNIYGWHTGMGHLWVFCDWNTVMRHL